MTIHEEYDEIINGVSLTVSRIVDEALRPIANRLEIVEQRMAPAGSVRTEAPFTVGTPVEYETMVLLSEDDESLVEPTTGNADGSVRDLKRDILEAAVELFHQKGFEATGVQEIVDRAGCTKGALYHYFRSKDEVLFELRNEFITNLLRRGREIRNGNTTATESLRLIITELILRVKDQRAHMSVAFLETRIDFERQPRASRDRDELKEILADIIRKGQLNKEFRPEIDLSAAVAQIATCAWAAFHWLPEETALNVERVIAIFTDLALHGLSAPA